MYHNLMKVSEKGIIVPLVLFGTVALLSGIGLLIYFYSYTFVNNDKTVSVTPAPIASTSAIVDFESCVSAGNLIQESYPRKCSALGKSFTEVVALASPSMSPVKEGWKVYVNSVDGYSISYPVNTFTKCGDKFYLFEGAEGTRECELGEEMTMFYITTGETSKHYQVSAYEQCYTVTKEAVTIDGLQANKYYATVKSKEGDCGLTEVAYADSHTRIDLTYKGRNYEIAYYRGIDQNIKDEILASLKFTD